MSKIKRKIFHWSSVNTTVPRTSSQFPCFSALLSNIRSFSEVKFSAHGQIQLCAFPAVFKLNWSSIGVHWSERWEHCLASFKGNSESLLVKCWKLYYCRVRSGKVNLCWYHSNLERSPLSFYISCTYAQSPTHTNTHMFLCGLLSALLIHHPSLSRCKENGWHVSWHRALRGWWYVLFSSFFSDELIFNVFPIHFLSRRV